MSESRLETVYANNAIVREAHRVNTTEANTAIQTLEDNFPEYSSYVSNHANNTIVNAIGLVDSYREPYGDGQHISLYCFNTIPNEVLTEFNVGTDIRGSLRPWYGFKFIVSTGDVFLKLPFDDVTNIYSKPDFGLDYKNEPIIPIHYANIYDTNGMTNQRDAYFAWGMGSSNPNTDEEVRECVQLRNICNEHDLPYPCPQQCNEDMSLFAVVYDTETLIPSLVKSYVLYGPDGSQASYE